MAKEILIVHGYSDSSESEKVEGLEEYFIAEGLYNK